MLYGFLHNFLMKNTAASEGTIILLLFLLAIGLINTFRVFRPTHVNGMMATVLNLLLPGLGQVYMKQLILGSGIVLFFLINFFYYPSLPWSEDVHKSLFLYMLIAITLALQYIFFDTAKKSTGGNWLHEIGALKYKRMVPVIERGTVLCLDTNILMHEQMFLIAMFRDSDAHLFVSKQVYAELDGLKKNNNRDVRNRAQLAFDLIELYLGEKRLTMVEIPPHSYLRKMKLASNPDEAIIGSYLYEKERLENPMVFLSNDKGARILATNANLETVTI